MKNLSKVILSALMFLVSSLAAGMEVNILSERQEFLLKPFLEQFEKDTGIKANVVYLKKEDWRESRLNLVPLTWYLR